MDLDLKEALRRRGIPLTHQRLAIYARLKKAKDHPSAEQLYAALKPKYPSLSLATVYKTLQTLVKLGLIQVVDTPHAQARYDAITRRHHHATCERCGRIEDLFDARLDALPVPAEAVHKFKITGHSVHFRGLCAKCAGQHTTRRKK
jgi:Fur family transcriptional regulator, peroxide stress response regulator